MPTMRRWVRPYERAHDDLYALRYALTGVMSVAGLVPLCGLTAGELSAAAVPVIVGFVVLWEVGIWRVVLVGVYVSDFGVKVRTVTWTHVIPWSRVVRAWAGQAAHYDAWQIWVSVRDPERDKETPIWRKGSRSRHRNRVVLPPDEFASVLAALDPHRTSFNGSRGRTGG